MTPELPEQQAQPQPASQPQSHPLSPRSPARRTARLLSERFLLSMLAGSLVAIPLGMWGRHTRIAGELWSAREASRLNDMPVASAAYRRYLSYRPADDVVRGEFAELLESADADAALDQWRRIPPGSAEYLTAARHVAALCLTLQRDSDATGPLLLLAEKLPEDAGVQQALAEISSRSRNWEAKLIYARRAHELAPQRIEPCLLMAEALDDLRRPLEMIEPLEAALAIDPERPEARLNLAYAYQLAGRNDEALAHVRWFLGMAPRSVAAHRILALVERGRGRLDEALAAIQMALQWNPQHLEAALLEAELLLSLRRPQEAWDRLRGFETDDTPDRRMLTLLAQLAARLGRHDDARRYRDQLQQMRDEPRSDQ